MKLLNPIFASRLVSNASIAIATIVSSQLLFTSNVEAAPLFDLPQLLKDALTIPNSSCTKLKTWISQTSPSSNPRPLNFGYLLPLVADKVFVPIFGQPYEQLTKNDFDTFQRETARTCNKQGGFTPTEWSLITQVWNPSTHQRLVPLIAKSKADQSKFQAMHDELARLLPNDQDYKRLHEIDSEGNALARQFSDEAKKSFNDQLSQAWLRVAVPIETQACNDALSRAQGADGLQTLSTLKKQLTSKKLPKEVLERLTAQVNQRISELLPPILRSETEEFQKLPQTMDGLAAGAKYLRSYEQKYRSLYSDAPETLQAKQSVIKHRSLLTTQLRPQIVARIDRLNNQQDLHSFIQDLFTDEELRQEPAISIKNTANEKNAQLAVRAKNDALFGPQDELDNSTCSKYGPVLSTKQELDYYEYPDILRAVYLANVGHFKSTEQPLFRLRYLIMQASVLNKLHKGLFKSTEIERYANKLDRAISQESMNGVMTKGFGNFLEILRDPIGTSIHMRENEQHIDKAFEYGMEDIDRFLKTYKDLDCGVTAIVHYSRNLKSYLENAL